MTCRCDQPATNITESPAAVARNYVPAEALHDANATLEAWRPVVEAAVAWRARIVDDPDVWADDEGFALIGAVDALPPGGTDG